MSFDPAAFQSLRQGAWGQPLIVLPETDSTQRVALDLAKEGAATGTVVLALSQSAGRGRWGRHWTASPGQSLLFSVILRPQAPARHWGALNAYFGSGACSAARALGLPAAQVKWPNDVWVGERKLAGLLAEVSGDALVLGLGMNVLQAAEDWPEELRNSATSFAAEGGKVSLEAALAQLLASLEQVLTRFDAGELGLLAKAWEAQALWLGEEVRLSLENGTGVQGRALGLDPSSGGLRLRLADGREKAFVTGEAEHLRPLGPA